MHTYSFLRHFTNLILMTGIIFILGCQTPMPKAIQQVKVGMYKDEVLELLGSPKDSRRKSSIDKWTYVYFDNNILQRKEVHFDDGRVIYVGEKIEPKVSAEEQDQINEKENVEVEKKENDLRIENQKAYEKFLENPRGEDAEGKPQKKPVFIPVQ